MTVPSSGHITTPVPVLIALGSNTLQVPHIQWASQRLKLLLSNVHLSNTLWTADIHGSRHYYMNRLATGTTTLSADVLQQSLKAIELQTMRSPGRVTIDLDLMLYDNQRYHLRDWPRPYIQQLLPEIRQFLPNNSV